MKKLQRAAGYTILLVILMFSVFVAAKASGAVRNAWRYDAMLTNGQECRADETVNCLLLTDESVRDKQYYSGNGEDEAAEYIIVTESGRYEVSTGFFGDRFYKTVHKGDTVRFGRVNGELVEIRSAKRTWHDSTLRHRSFWASTIMSFALAGLFGNLIMLPLFRYANSTTSNPLSEAATIASASVIFAIVSGIAAFICLLVLTFIIDVQWGAYITWALLAATSATFLYSNIQENRPRRTS